uniref:Uncharacterized protein LOC117356822 n=1 Tax=Geotrypetes seraphini TaxID=260995 RepID=A0A6P8Q824_GEOSA|nr:uncharacterized protein LOC117356822 [Geotrypetes seraphini]
MEQTREEELVRVSTIAAAQGTFSIMGPRMESAPFQRPKVINMETIWEAISSLQLSLGNQIQQLSTTCMAMLSEHTEIKNKLSTVEKMAECETRLKNLELQASIWVKDSGNLHFKNEMLENVTKRCNLRIINFPKVFPISAQDMLKQYLNEILKVPEVSYPPLSKIYYLPGKIKSHVTNQQNLSADSLDLTNLLERSDSEAQAPATLLVQFAIDSDRERLLKLFFKYRDVSFMAYKVRMYSDVCKPTQKRRKQFLLLRPQVLRLGATFILRYPYKCVMVYKGNRYVFYEPQQLFKFISTQSIPFS